MNIIKACLLSFKKRRMKNMANAADFIYQVREYKSELWLTYNGNLVCPVSMLKDDIVKSLNTMRAYYIARNGNDEEQDTMQR